MTYAEFISARRLVANVEMRCPRDELHGSLELLVISGPIRFGYVERAALRLDGSVGRGAIRRRILVFQRLLERVYFRDFGQ